jgi:hypothetical protein
MFPYYLILTIPLLIALYAAAVLAKHIPLRNYTRILGGGIMIFLSYVAQVLCIALINRLYN